jgi:hypothetical protein
MRMDIDVTFDFRRDTLKGKDPDTHSKTLRRYHKLLSTKPLPGGEVFGLDDDTPGSQLHHQSTVGELLVGQRCGNPNVQVGALRWPRLLEQRSPVRE